MKVFAIVGIFCLAQVTLGLPQYGGVQPSNGRRPASQRPVQRPVRRPSGGVDKDGCRTEYKTVNDVSWHETNEEVCTPYQRRQCDNKFRKKCTPYQEDECKTEHKRECQTLYKDECKELYRDVSEPYTEDHCVEDYIKVCEKHWVQVGPNDKVWQDDPTKCQDVPQTKCSPVKKTRTRKEPYTQCDKKPYQDCQRVPYQNCYKVDKQRCKNEPYEDCYNVPDKRCENVHKRIPTTTSRQQAIRVCDGGQGGDNYGSGNNGSGNVVRDDYDYDAIFDERGGDVPEKLDTKPRDGLEEDAEKVEPKTKPANSGAITFGR